MRAAHLELGDDAVATGDHVDQAVVEIGEGIEERVEETANLGVAAVAGFHRDIEPFHLRVEARQHAGHVVRVEVLDHLAHGLAVALLGSGQVF